MKVQINESEDEFKRLNTIEDLCKESLNRIHHINIA